KILFLTQFSMLLAIEAIVCFTPLGSLPIGPMVATLSALPVIVTTVILGTKPGMLMGLFFGLFSFIVWTFMPPNPALAFVFTPFYSFGKFNGSFWSIVICFVPRILIGAVTGVCITMLTKLMGEKKSKAKFGAICTLSGVLGSLTNTILVLGGIYLFFGKNYATANGMAYELLLGAIGTVILTNGLLEAVLGGVFGGAISPLKDRLNKTI
ncbi:MAG: ECF transporter S component, partial [Oscillospiraceae bacterium]